MSTSLMAGPEANAVHFASTPRCVMKPMRSMTMLTVFCPDHGAWNATWIGHQPLSLSHLTDFSDTFSCCVGQPQSLFADWACDQAGSDAAAMPKAAVTKRLRGPEKLLFVTIAVSLG